MAGLRERMGSVYYGWWVLTATTVLGIVSGGIFAHATAIYFRPIRQDLGLTRFQTAMIFTLSRAEGSIAGPVVGRMVDKFGARVMIIGGGIVASLGFMMLKWVDTYWVFLVIYLVVVSTGKSAGLGQTLISAANRWFVRRRSLAITITVIGFSAGGAVILPLITQGVSSIGWRDVMFYAGMAMMVLVVPLGLVVRSSPESMGLEPEGVEQMRREQSRGGKEADRREVDPDFTVREAFSTRAFWMLFLGSVFRITVWGAISVHAVEMMVAEGISPEASGFLVALMFFISIPTRLIFGTVGIWMPVQPVLGGAMAAAALAMVSLLVFDGWLAVLLFVTFMALEQGGTVVNWVALGNFFGRNSFATLFGTMSAVFNLGMIASTQFAAWAADRNDGSYDWALIAFLPLYGAAALMYFSMRKPRVPDRLPPNPAP